MGTSDKRARRKYRSTADSAYRGKKTADRGVSGRDRFQAWMRRRTRG